MLQFEHASPTQRRLVVALLAIASGIASYNAIIYRFLEWFDWITLAPGVLFGAVLAFAIAWTRKPALAPSLIIIALTTLAWYLATVCWLVTDEILQPFFRTVGPGGQLNDNWGSPYKSGLVGIVTGLVGAVLTWAAVAVVRPETRAVRLVLNIALFGAVAGVLSATTRYADTSGPMNYTAFLVFPVWQTGVALLLMNATMKGGAGAAPSPQT